MRLTFWTGFWVFLLDQLSKYLVVHTLDLAKVGRIEVFPPFLVFRMAWNTGVNFGLLSGADMRWVLIAVAVVITAAVLIWVRREGGNRWSQIGAGLLAGGALGNVVDRLVYGAVADFLNMSCCGIDNPFAFNLADAGIFLGAVLLVIFGGKDESRQGHKTP
jgi:signal peptidase II